jgi:hypothetical protein
MNKLFEECSNFLIFMDDILVANKSLEQQYVDLKMLFRTLKKTTLQLIFKKVDF